MDVLADREPVQMMEIEGFRWFSPPAGNSVRVQSLEERPLVCHSIRDCGFSMLKLIA